MTKDRKYVGRVETKTTQYGDIIKLSLGPNDIAMINDSKSPKGWVTIDIKPSSKGGLYGEIGMFQKAVASQDSDDMPF
jgi:hypothetical protein